MSNKPFIYQAPFPMLSLIHISMIQQSAGNIQFSGCNGQSVNLKVMANNVTLAGSKQSVIRKLTIANKGG